jgi:hypothetical protein
MSTQTPGGPYDPMAAAAEREAEERRLAMRKLIDDQARTRRRVRLIVLLGLVVAAAYGLVRFVPGRESRPVVAWERRVATESKITGPSIGTSPNGKWFAIAWAEGSRIWYLRGASELSGKLRLDAPVMLTDTDHPFAAFDEDPPKAAVDNDGQVAVAWMTRPVTRPEGSVIAVARPNLARDGAVALTRIEGSDPAGFLLCEALGYDDDGGLVATWLDGGRPEESKGEQGTIDCAVAGPQGGFESVTTLADSACTCCRSSVAWLGPETFAVAYRGVASGNVRDIRFGVLGDESGKGGAPSFTSNSQAIVRNDGWALDGCPSAGPTVAAVGENAAWVSWYTEGDPRGLYLARLEPRRGARGLRWETVQTLVVDPRKEARHPSMATLSSGRPVVVFEGPTPEGGNALFARVLRGKGLSEPVRFTTATRAERATPARWGNNGALIAWRESDELGPRIVLSEWKGL